MEQEKLYFDTLKVDRHWYFVEYSPPQPTSPFASVHLVITEEVEAERVAVAMEKELQLWLQRYPVTVMVSSFDSKGLLINLNPVRSFDHILGWKDLNTGSIVSHWRLVSNEELPQLTWDPASLKSIYGDISSRTSTQLKQSARKQQRVLKFGWWLVFLWSVVIPVGIALLELFSPIWLAILAFFYSVTMAYIQWMKMLGKWPKTDMEISKEEEERRMHHHHYHCERNPEGFRRLVLENLERESREQIQSEVAALKGKLR